MESSITQENFFILALTRMIIDLPNFGKIQDIIVLTERTPLVQLQIYRTMGINNHIIYNIII